MIKEIKRYHNTCEIALFSLPQIVNSDQAKIGKKFYVLHQGKIQPLPPHFHAMLLKSILELESPVWYFTVNNKRSD